MRFPVISMSAFFARREIFRSIQEKPYLDYENRFLVCQDFSSRATLNQKINSLRSSK